MKRIFWVFLSIIPIVLWSLLQAFGVELGIVSPEFVGSSTYYVIMVILIILPIIASFSIFLPPMLSFFGGSPKTRRILKTGRPADGVIKRIGESSMGGVTTVNDQPYVNLTIEVHDSVRTPYIVSIDTILPRLLIPQFQPGAIIPVKVDTENPQDIAIDWERV